MEAIGLLVMLEARPGEEADAETFLKSAQGFSLFQSGEVLQTISRPAPPMPSQSRPSSERYALFICKGPCRRMVGGAQLSCICMAGGSTGEQP